MFDYVCFNITSLCNLSCPFCYRVGSSLGFASLKSARHYIEQLKAFGCNTINITGGEPLLNPYWREIIDYCYSMDLTTILSTNGLLLDINDSSLKKVKVLSLPLESGYARENDLIRAHGHYNKILDIINQYVAGNYPLKLKINTVITPDNINSLDKLLNCINYNNIIWKLFELREKGFFYNYQKKECTAFPIKEAIEKVLQTPHNCSIYFMGKNAGTPNSINPNYIVLNYNGDIYLATDNDNRKIGNLNNGRVLLRYSLKNLNNQYNEELKNDI